MSLPRTRILIIGRDYPMFHVYWRPDIQSPEREICGFVYVSDEEPPIHSFKGTGKTPIRVFPLIDLEKEITRLRIQKCLIQAQNVAMPKLTSVIHRILAVGRCEIEFIPPAKIALRSFKPIVVVSSLAPALGKTQVTRYMASILSQKEKKVAVIMPISMIETSVPTFDVEDGPHFEFKNGMDVPNDTFSDDDRWQIQQYLKAGADCVFATSDIRKAIISSEQKAHIILVDARNCETPPVLTNMKFCVVTRKTVSEVRECSMWPGLVNLMTSTNIVVVSHKGESLERSEKDEFEKMLGHGRIPPVRFFHVMTSYVLDNSSGMEIFNRPVLTVDHADTAGSASEAARMFGPSQVIKSSVLAKVPRMQSPNRFLQEEAKEEMKQIADVINRSDADVVVVALQRDLTGIVPGKQVLYTTPEITDHDYSIYYWLSQFFKQNGKPPLQEHFAAQVDIIMAMASASDSELYVMNNDSANREAFCRLFLSSHIPPGFRVTTGEIIDSASNITGQLDVVVVNDSCPRMTVDATGSVIAPILADTVLSVIEVKTSLTSDQLKKALSQLRPVKALMPTHQTLLSPDGHVVEDPLGGKIITGIFSFNPGADIEQKVTDILALYPGVADFIVLPDSFGYFAAETLKVCGISVQQSEVVNGYVKYGARGMGLAILFGILNSLAATRRFSGSNLIRYLSGSWGGVSEEAARSTQAAARSLQSIDKIVAQEGSHEQRRQFYRRKKEFFELISEVQNDLKTNSQPRSPRKDELPLERYRRTVSKP